VVQKASVNQLETVNCPLASVM